LRAAHEQDRSVIVVPEVRLAVPGDARSIAQLSRDNIEHGLNWKWTEARVLRAIASRVVNVAVVHERGRLLAFGVMEYGDQTAHLVLLGVHPSERRRGLGRAVVTWLEACADAAGVGHIRVEARADNPTGIAFYEKLDYRIIGRIPGYYTEFLDGVRLEKRLWISAG
jgi:ribosomal-protein-alanine N-acetyltransferase